MNAGRRQPRLLAHRNRGFTLIEVMVVVALLAIILAIAIPNYRDYVIRSNRSAARQVLVEAAQYLERVHTFSGCYNFADTPSCIKQSGSETVKPSPLTRAPSDGRQTHAVTWDYSNSGTQFTLTATPCGDAGNCPAGAETSFRDPACGALTLTQTGARGASGNVTTCWAR